MFELAHRVGQAAHFLHRHITPAFAADGVHIFRVDAVLYARLFHLAHKLIRRFAPVGFFQADRAQFHVFQQGFDLFAVFDVHAFCHAVELGQVAARLFHLLPRFEGFPRQRVLDQLVAFVRRRLFGVARLERFFRRLRRRRFGAGKHAWAQVAGFHLFHAFFGRHTRGLFQQRYRPQRRFQAVEFARNQARPHLVVHRQIGRFFKIGLRRHFAFFRQQVQAGGVFDGFLRRQCLNQCLHQIEAV